MVIKWGRGRGVLMEGEREKELRSEGKRGERMLDRVEREWEKERRGSLLMLWMPSRYVMKKNYEFQAEQKMKTISAESEGEIKTEE